MGIKYINLKDFSTMEQREIKDKSEKEYKKIIRDFKDSSLIVEVKKMEKAGDRCKYSVHLRLEGGTSLILTAHQTDWDLPRALHKTLDNLKNEADHKYHTEQHKNKKKNF
jgi:hypothetical protein